MVQVDDSFRRWRDNGDADALADVYDNAAPSLLRLALHHVRHPATAEDLVQATFLAAIQNARSYDAERPLLAWLTGILHNQAKWLQRREGRTVDPTRLPERAERDPLAAAQAAEFSAQCDEAIEGLPEAYRPVLRLHLKHQLTAAEIAHALGRQAGTVRSQVVRGLDLLRAALPAGVALAAFAALVPARGLDGVRDIVLTAGRAHAASAAAATAATATALLGGMTMKKAMLGVVVLLVLSAGAWWSMAQTAGPVRAAPPAPTVETVAADATALTKNAAAIGEAPQLSRDEAAAGPVSWRLVGRAFDSNGVGIAGVEVCANASFDHERERLGDARTDAMGRYAIDLEALRALAPIDLDRATLSLTMQAPGNVADGQVQLPHRDPTRSLVAIGDGMLTTAAVLVGRIVDDDGRPVVDADVRLGPRTVGGSNPSDRATSDAGGNYRLLAMQSADVRIDAEHHVSGRASAECTVTLGNHTSLPDLVLQASSTLRARVVFADGEPAARVRMLIHAPGDDSTTVAMARTDGDGNLAVRTLRPGSYDVRLAAFGDPSGHATRVATDQDVATIVLGDVHVLRFSFADEAGRSLRPMDVAMGIWPAANLAAAAFAAGAPMTADLDDGAISAAGSFSSLAVARGTWVRVDASHGLAHAETMVQALPPRHVIDTVLTLRERARDGTLRLQLTTPDGSDPGHVAIRLHQLYLGEPGSHELEPERSADGLLVRWSAGRYRLEVTPKQAGADFGWFAPFERLVELRREATTTVASPLPIGGRVRFHLNVPDAKPGAKVADFAVETPAATGVAGQRRRVFIETTAEGWRSVGEPPAGVPLLWAPVLPTGRHVLTMRSREFADVTMTAVIAAREATDVHVWLQPR